MKQANLAKRSTWIWPAVLAAALGICGARMDAQTAPQGEKKEATTTAPATKEKMSEEAFKNVQVLKGIPASQFINNMQFIAESLGVFCDHCHVTSDNGPWPMEKDDKEAKLTARKMILMTRAINEANFNSRPQISCASCHQGKLEPSRVPPIRQWGVPPSDQRVQTAEKPPSADELLAKYVAALGGEAALGKITSRVWTGAVTTESGHSSAIEVDQGGGGKILITVTQPNGPANFGYDGATGWNRFGENAFEMKGLELARLERDGALFPDVDLKTRLPRMRVFGKDKVGDADAWVLFARGEGTTERLYFDATSGLLLRRIVLTNTPLGPFAEQVDYSDYRDVDGAKVPFTIERLEINTRWKETFTDVKQNVTLDPSKFAAPTDLHRRGE